MFCRSLASFSEQLGPRPQQCPIAAEARRSRPCRPAPEQNPAAAGKVAPLGLFIYRTECRTKKNMHLFEGKDRSDHAKEL